MEAEGRCGINLLATPQLHQNWRDATGGVGNPLQKAGSLASARDPYSRTAEGVSLQIVGIQAARVMGVSRRLLGGDGGARRARSTPLTNPALALGGVLGTTPECPRGSAEALSAGPHDF